MTGSVNPNLNYSAQLSFMIRAVLNIQILFCSVTKNLANTVFTEPNSELRHTNAGSGVIFQPQSILQTV